MHVSGIHVSQMTPLFRGGRSPEARVTGGCELSDVGAGDQTQAF